MNDERAVFSGLSEQRLKQCSAALVTALSEKALTDLEQCLAGDYKNGTDEILNWALQHVAGACRPCDYGTSRAVFIHSQSLAADLGRYEDRTRDYALRGDFLRPLSLRCLAEHMQASTLEADPGIDLLLMPLNTEHCHWSLLVVDLRRLEAVHLDSVGFPEHTRLAGKALNMLFAANMLTSSALAFREPRIDQQRNGALCAYCVALLAERYVAEGHASALATSFANSRLKALMLRAKRRNRTVEALQRYKERLECYFWPDK